MDAIAIKAMSPEERLALIDQLWDSLEPEDIPLTAAQTAELDRRLETADVDIANGVSWETLKAEMRQRYPRR